MNLLRIALTALGAFVAYFAFGGLVFGLLPSLRKNSSNTLRCIGLWKE
jgi:hypothetical protein